jgi:hypothetical protein
MDGDWCLVDLTEPIMEEATKYAHALGMNFHDFISAAVDEKLAKLRSDQALRGTVGKIEWEPMLK